MSTDRHTELLRKTLAAWEILEGYRAEDADRREAVSHLALTLAERAVLALEDIGETMARIRQELP